MSDDDAEYEAGYVAELTEAFYLDARAGANLRGLRRHLLRPSTIKALDAALARLNAERGYPCFRGRESMECVGCVTKEHCDRYG